MLTVSLLANPLDPVVARSDAGGGGGADFAPLIAGLLDPDGKSADGTMSPPGLPVGGAVLPALPPAGRDPAGDAALPAVPVAAPATPATPVTPSRFAGLPASIPVERPPVPAATLPLVLASPPPAPPPPVLAVPVPVPAAVPADGPSPPDPMPRRAVLLATTAAPMPAPGVSPSPADRMARAAPGGRHAASVDDEDDAASAPAAEPSGDALSPPCAIAVVPQPDVAPTGAAPLPGGRDATPPPAYAATALTVPVDRPPAATIDTPVARGGAAPASVALPTSPLSRAAARAAQPTPLAPAADEPQPVVAAAAPAAIAPAAFQLAAAPDTVAASTAPAARVAVSRTKPALPVTGAAASARPPMPTPVPADRAVASEPVVRVGVVPPVWRNDGAVTPIAHDRQPVTVASPSPPLPPLSPSPPTAPAALGLAVATTATMVAPVPAAPPGPPIVARADPLTPIPTRATTSATVERAAPAVATVPVAVAAPNAAPLILPALQAFGAAMRQALADERKPAARSGDDAMAVVPGVTAATAPVTVPAAARDDATLDTADRRWPHAMAEQIERLRDTADAQSTRIRLLPDALGPVDVAVRRDGDQVHVHFTAAQAETRQLLVDAQPRLADAAEARGVKLGRADVSGGDLTGQRQQQRPAAQTPQPSRPAPARASATVADPADSRLA